MDGVTVAQLLKSETRMPGSSIRIAAIGDPARTGGGPLSRTAAVRSRLRKRLRHALHRRLPLAGPVPDSRVARLAVATPRRRPGSGQAYGHAGEPTARNFSSAIVPPGSGCEAPAARPRASPGSADLGRWWLRRQAGRLDPRHSAYRAADREELRRHDRIRPAAKALGRRTDPGLDHQPTRRETHHENEIGSGTGSKSGATGYRGAGGAVSS